MVRNVKKNNERSEYVLLDPSLACVNEKTVNEYSCLGNVQSLSSVACAQGQVCKEGKCIVSGEENKKTMKDISKTRIKRLIKELADLGVFKIVFTHGESLIRRDVFEIISFCYNLDI